MSLLYKLLDPPPFNKLSRVNVSDPALEEMLIVQSSNIRSWPFHTLILKILNTSNIMAKGSYTKQKIKFNEIKTIPIYFMQEDKK